MNNVHISHSTSIISVLEYRLKSQNNEANKRNEKKSKNINNPMRKILSNMNRIIQIAFNTGILEALPNKDNVEEL